MTATPIKTLRASGARLQADVVIGANQFGSAVTVRVELDRRDPALLEALDPVQKLLRERALSYVSSSRSELEIRQLVDERLQAQLARRRERIKKNATTEQQAALEVEKRRATSAELALSRTQHALEKARQELAEVKLGQAQ